METVNGILLELEKMGTPTIKKVLMNHGAREPFFGVRVGDMKTIVKRVKKDYALSLALYETGNSDAMYLAGLIADEEAMTEQDLDYWAEQAYWHMLSEYSVAWVAAESKFGYKLGMKWIDDEKEQIAVCGWSTLGGLLALGRSAHFAEGELAMLIDRVVKTLHKSKNRVRYAMNSFLIAVGTYVPSLRAKAIAAGNALGEIQVDMGGTACKVPEAPSYIEKAAAKWNGKFKKTVRC